MLTVTYKSSITLAHYEFCMNIKYLSLTFLSGRHAINTVTNGSYLQTLREVTDNCTIPMLLFSSDLKPPTEYYAFYSKKKMYFSVGVLLIHSNVVMRHAEWR